MDITGSPNAAQGDDCHCSFAGLRRVSTGFRGVDRAASEGEVSGVAFFGGLVYSFTY